MPAQGTNRSARAAARTRLLIALTLSPFLAACASAGASRASVDRRQEARTITFENTTNAALRVYLISEGTEWLLGRVYPVETAELTLPAGVRINPHQPFSLAVVPIGTAPPGPTRVSDRATRLISPHYPAHHLTSMRFGIIGGQVYSMLKPR